jgi:hypothetical protein
VTRRTLIALVVALLAVAACGGDDDDAPAVAAAPDTTNRTGDIDTAAADFRATDEACGGEAAELMEGVNPVETLTEVDGGDLLLITCDTFAYQATYDLRFWDGTDIQAVQVQQWIDGSVEDDSVLLGSPYMDDDGHLANLEKARGPGDCGVFSTWTVSSAEVLLLEVHSKECDDSTMDDIDPTAWPTVYSAD